MLFVRNLSQHELLAVILAVVGEIQEMDQFRFLLLDSLPTEVDDALELLGPGTVDSRVRNFAVKQLAKAEDDVSGYSQNIVIYKTIYGDSRPRNSYSIYCNYCRLSNSKAPRTTNGQYD